MHRVRLQSETSDSRDESERHHKILINILSGSDDLEVSGSQ